MEGIDLEYLCRMIGNLAGIPVRIYKDKELTEEEKLHISKRTKYFISLGASIYQKSDGFYEWVLRGEKDEEINTFLHLRRFTDEDKSARYNAQGGIDPIDGQHYEIEDMEAHHIKSWKNGGDSKYDNLVLLSKKNHRAFHNGDLNITADESRKKRDELCKKQQNKTIILISADKL